MRVESVTAHAFGALVGASLELAPGLTVVFGGNERGKSTWHAALTAALCGRRRARGQPRKEDAQFAARHQPWTGTRWAVRCVLRLDDGRRIEIEQDLAAGNGTAIDLVTGRDVTDEILNKDGMPDATIWLGLERQAFAAVASVRQADILALTQNAEALQEWLQRAAASARSDPTAARALERVQAFRAEHVGSERASTKPSARARARLAQAADACREARRVHGESQQLAEERDAARCAAADAEADLRVAEAVLAEHAARAARGRADAATALSAEFAAGRAPSVPAGDLVVHADVRAARDVLHAAVAALGHQLGNEPERPGAPPPADVATLLEWARDLEASAPPVDATVVAHAERLRVRRDELAAREAALALRLRAGLVAGFVLGGLTALAQPVVGALILAAGLAVAFLALRAGVGAERARVLDELAAADAELRAAHVRVDEAAVRRRTAASHAGALGLDAEPAALRALAQRASEALGAAGRHAEWATRREACERAQHEARDGLRAALAGRGVEVASTDEPLELLGRYERDCAERAENARRAAEEQAERWGRLQELLDGRTLDDLVAAAVDAETLARERAAGIEAATLASLRARSDVAAEARRLRACATEAQQSADRLEGRLDEALRGLANVAEAEEEEARARAEVERLAALDDVLQRTEVFLQSAQDRVHRTIAPQLAEAVRPALARVTGGRWDAVIVSPETLAVQVRGAGAWQDASLLSHGTSEQVYLLLRVAMAQHLVTNAESCPLLLDDVTVQCDAERSAAVLDLLHEMARERQIILFSQEEDVRAWAAARLDGRRDRLVSLDGPLGG